MARLSVPEVRASRSTDAAPGSTDFAAAIAANKRNTFWLCVLLTLLGMAFGGAVGFAVGYYGPPEAIVTVVILGAIVMLVISMIAISVALSFGGSVVSRIAGATDVSAEAEPQLHNVVEEMCIAAGLPKPRIVVIETPALNAFAAGRSPEKAVVGVTRGLLETMNRDELQGVIAHEMSHVGNRDTLYMTAVAVLVGLIVLLCDVMRRFGYHAARGGGRRSTGSGSLAMIIVLVVSIVAPLAAMALRMAVSRQREYLADATSVKLTRNPLGLIAALEKIGASTTRMESPNRAIQHLFIDNPIQRFGEQASALMATHPPIEKRVARLLNLGA